MEIYERRVKIEINDYFWTPILKMNENIAIFHQWEQLEKTGCINNFRLLLNRNRRNDNSSAKNDSAYNISNGIHDRGLLGFREGWFYSDSDAYKWLDAACRIYRNSRDKKLLKIIDEFIGIIENVQDKDGYIFSYNQFHFPGKRWINLQIEHELYCLGHLIEAAISHYEATGRKNLLNVAIKAANLIYKDFYNDDPKLTSGHEEIEIALLKLFKCTMDFRYLELADKLIRKRGKIHWFWLHFLANTISMIKRLNNIKKQRDLFYNRDSNLKKVELPPRVKIDKPFGINIRSFFNFATGKYNQQHKPVEFQLIPEGHSVRFTYLAASESMLYNEKKKLNEKIKEKNNAFAENSWNSNFQYYNKLMNTLERSWEHMISKRMFHTGGIGSLPIIEGFGFDYELKPRYAYCESCAAIGSFLWSYQMGQATNIPKSAKYYDLMEWQLYNAILPGISLDGRRYLYRNPIISNGKLKREHWYETPCCPSNISRILADLGNYILSYEPKGNSIYLLQYISSNSEIEINLGQLSDNQTAATDATENVGTVGSNKNGKLYIKIDSGFPWNGTINIEIMPSFDSAIALSLIENTIADMNFYFRIPSWAESYSIWLNNELYKIESFERNYKHGAFLSGFNPTESSFLHIHGSQLKKMEENKYKIRIEFPFEIKMIQYSPKVKAMKNYFAISRGPLIYCLEKTDNKEIDIFKSKLDFESLKFEMREDIIPNIKAGIIKGKTLDNKEVILVPYFSWGNRGSSKMATIFLKSSIFGKKCASE
ncbi:MAG: glycoside hydrolase family 127 protein [Promethearchaeota archaeon]